jgi:DNA-binding response OmpR family regulator
MSATILVMDDEQDFLDLIGYQLKGGGFEVITADNGMTGLNMARRHLPDVILLDLQLPDIDGFSVCEILRKQPSTMTIPVVLVTAMAGEIIRANGVASGADHFLPKPIVCGAVCACVQRILRARQAELEAETAAPEGADWQVTAPGAKPLRACSAGPCKPL